MATDEEQMRQHILAQATRSFPKAFLMEALDRIRRAYLEEFSAVAHNVTTLAEQRIFKLNQDRCFRIDWELHEAAAAHGLNVTAKELPYNKWHHTYVTAGAFGLTQSYVPRAGDLPQPAKFRDALAEAANCPRLPLDDSAEIYSAKEFYALFAHTPVGRRFSEDEQKLGTLMFCVPDRTMKSWALSVGVPEIIALYPADEKAKKEDRTVPTWRRDKDAGSKKA
ncbi:hypothetical protein [Nitratireductor sp. StC3]|uniref:hypothetical protein n=1 Tax=Nitratireductor sp. StC3 TaxID=2126741 RepID=UPI000D0CFA82|nr:hypothetical protein [Nitratireductor sp. StC3]PSM17117.1 hypothetical protein C7T96_16635 [Nitratireductor sp. StC3]